MTRITQRYPLSLSTIHSTIIPGLFLFNQYQIFVIGSTRIYDFTSFVPECAQSLSQLLAESAGKPICLPCGVYGGDKAPPIDVVVVALSMDGGDFLAISIEAQKGSELDALAYGVKRIEVFDNLKATLFQRIFDIVPKEGMSHTF
jgi:hypothetical protein